MRVRVPASSANLGPGFDALALALNLYVEVSLEPHDEIVLSAEGYGSELDDVETHLGVRVAKELLGMEGFRLHVKSEIPLARGLGSSAALAVAVAAAAGSHHALEIGTHIDGHAENAAASVFGGFVTASLVDQTISAVKLPLDPELRFVVAIPDRPLATEKARSVLPTTVTYQDVAFNLSRVAMLVTGLSDHRRLLRDAMDDRLHQPYRMPLLPFASDVLNAMVEGGGLTSCWSGAGSTLLGVATETTAPSVQAAAQQVLAEHDEPGTVMVLEADLSGVTIL